MNKPTISELVRTARRRSNMTQEELGKQMGKSRYWVIQLEKGERFSGEDFQTNAATVVQLAGVLNADPREFLMGTDIPVKDWPKLSYMRSNDGIVRTVELAGLSEKQANLVEQLVDELRAENDNHARRDSQHKHR